MSESDYSFVYDSDTKTLAVTCNVNAVEKQKIFVTPSYDFGAVDKTRQKTPETDYLNIIKENILTLTFFENGANRVETVSIDNGSSYNNGIYLKLDESGNPVKIVENEEISIVVEYDSENITEDRRISFEVI